MDILNAMGQWLSETYQYILAGLGLLFASGGAYLANVWSFGKKLLPIKDKVDGSVSQSEFNNLSNKVDLILEMQKDNTEATLSVNTVISDEQRAKLESNIQKANDILPTFIDNVKSVVSKY